ncbi:MAG: beta-galactosidase [Planctomycetota bacterium]
MNHSKFLFSTLVLLTAFLCLSSRGAVPSTLVLDDFEKASSLERWKGAVSLSGEHPAHGKSCLKLDLRDRRSRSIESEVLPRDWSSYKLLKFDIYTPGDIVQVGSIQISDELGSDEAAETYGKSYRGRKIFLNRGWNHFEFLLQKAMVEDGDRALALDKIRKFGLYFGGLRVEAVYIDNIRLVNGEEETGTASAVDARDCRVLIDDRYVYPSLVGPMDEITPSGEIVRLRAEAEKEVRLLKRELELAIFQGHQGLYWKIPLITADIGLGLRSKCVWFQGEKEEKEILDYVISSCRKARNEIVALLSARERGEESQEEITEVSPVTRIPTYPPLRGLKQSDGYFRDEYGEPVILFSMIRINSGPLLDFFAPMDHRLESYTVGGGSRGDIETSPVYEAFHKYPDTHRVGWDGWCGHLIKDRWSMGGRKENVVICLESPHIRRAVLEYMKRRYNEWKHNPHLLYNIMAYELMYICYCERSQGMFREWLADKYKAPAALNKIWGTNYTSFDQIKAPATLNARPLDDVNRAAWYDWACFNNRRFTDYLKWVKSEIRKLDQVVAINAGGTSSMLNSQNSTTGIDEEMIINEVDDVILNESGSSNIFSDLFLSLSEERKVMVEPEMGGGVHNILLHFLHGKSSITKWWWPQSSSREFPTFAAQSVPHSWSISLAEVAEVLKVALDIRRLRNEIAEFTKPEPELAILYSKSSIIQVPPRLIRAGRTPYLNAVFSAWEGSRYLGCRIGFVSEKQILAGKLSGFKLLIVPAVKYSLDEVADAVLEYVDNGGVAVVVPESFLFDQYARENDRVRELGLKITDITLPQVLGKGELVQNYDQSFTQRILYGQVKRTVRTEKLDIFRNHQPRLQTAGLVQSLEPGNNTVLARFDDGQAAVVLVKRGKGRIYYLASPLTATSYHELMSALAEQTGLKRPVVGVDSRGKLVTSAEVRSVERKSDYLVYASNLGAGPVEFVLKGKSEIGAVEDLRRLRVVPGGRVKLGPWEETIFRVEKP